MAEKKYNSVEEMLKAVIGHATLDRMLNKINEGAQGYLQDGEVKQFMDEFRGEFDRLKGDLIRKMAEKYPHVDLFGFKMGCDVKFPQHEKFWVKLWPKDDEATSEPEEDEPASS